jgi:hypothetical protein
MFVEPCDQQQGGAVEDANAGVGVEEVHLD